MWIQFADEDESSGKGGGISIYFDSQMKYSLGYCEFNVHIPHAKLGTDKSRTWTIVKVDTRMKLFCNGDI